MPETQPEKTAESTSTKTSTTWMPTRRFFAAVIAIAGMQLMATMDGTIAIVALPKIQNELSLSDAGRSWVITAYVLTFGGLMLLGGRLGDTIGRKRTFIVGVTLFTIASALCGIAWDDVTLVIARLLQGVGAAIASPTGFALVATTFAKGPARNAATAVFGAMMGIGSVMGLVVGGALTEMSWRLAFFVNVPIGLVMIYLARTALRETNRERMKLDAAGAVLATLACTAAVFAFSTGPEAGWISVHHTGFGRTGAGRVHRVRVGGALSREPRRAIRFVLRPQPAGHLRGHLHGRWLMFTRDRAGCACMCRTSWGTARCAPVSASSRSRSRWALVWLPPRSWYRASSRGSWSSPAERWWSARWSTGRHSTARCRTSRT